MTGNTYVRIAYGELEGAALSTEAGAAPFRFQGHYSDSAVKTYDMQARSYRPDIGRFLSQDRYEGASADVMLQSDPLTQNRYAFGSSNPVDNVEFDGHDPHAIETGCKDDPNCGDRVGLASAAQSGPGALGRAKRDLRAFKPVQTVARSKAASEQASKTKPGTVISVKVELDGVNYFADPNTCTTSVECFKQDATRTTKWSQTPSGQPATTTAQLRGANNARSFDAGRLTRQQAVNQLGYRGKARDTYLGWERDAPTALTARIAATFDPQPQTDRSVGLRDFVNLLGPAGDAIGQAPRVLWQYGQELPSNVVRAAGPVGLAVSATGDVLGGRGPFNVVMRAGVGAGVSVVGGAATIVVCTVAAAPTAELAAPPCFAGGAAATIAANAYIQSKLPK